MVRGTVTRRVPKLPIFHANSVSWTKKLNALDHTTQHGQLQSICEVLSSIRLRKCSALLLCCSAIVPTTAILHEISIRNPPPPIYVQTGHFKPPCVSPLPSTLSKQARCHKCLHANKTSAPSFSFPSSTIDTSTSGWLGLLPLLFPLPSSSLSSIRRLALSSSAFSHASHTLPPAPGPHARFLQASHTWPRGRHPRLRSSVISCTCSKPSLSRKRFARLRMVSSKV